MLDSIIDFLENVVLRFIVEWIIFPLAVLFYPLIIFVFSLFKYIKSFIEKERK